MATPPTLSPTVVGSSPNKKTSLQSLREGVDAGFAQTYEDMEAGDAAATEAAAEAVASAADAVAEAEAAGDIGRAAVDQATDGTYRLYYTDGQPPRATITADGFIASADLENSAPEVGLWRLYYQDGQPALVEAVGDPDTSLRILRAYDVAGTQTSPVATSDSELPEYLGYLDGAEVHGVAAADVVMADAAPFTVSAVAPGRGHVKAVINRPGLSALSRVAAADDLLIPDAGDALHVVLMVGQSLAAGSFGTLLTTTALASDAALIFDTVIGPDVRMGLPVSGVIPDLDPADLTGFAPARAVLSPASSGYGNTPAEALAVRLATEAQQRGVRFAVLAIASARGGTGYADMKKGGGIPQLYNNLIAGVARAKVLAEADGLRLIVDAVLVKHGEHDQSNTASEYAAKLVEWQADIEGDVQAITGQAAGVPFLMAPPSSFIERGGPSLAMASLHRTNPDFHLTGPDYAYHAEYATDRLHFTGPGYHLIGEKAALAAVDALWSPGGKSRPLIVSSVSRAGAVVTVQVSVPYPPLVLDTALVDAVSNNGLAYSVGGVAQTINSVAITNSGASGTGTITITLASAPAGTAGRLDVAWPGHSDGVDRLASEIPRTNFRDSDPRTSSYDGRRLYSWLTHDQITHT